MKIQSTTAITATVTAPTGGTNAMALTSDATVAASWTEITVMGSRGTGSNWTVTLNGTSYTYTTVGGSTRDDILFGLQALIPNTFTTSVDDH